jgi:hypothetical protein
MVAVSPSYHFKQVVGANAAKRKDACRLGCTMVKVTEVMWLCPHASWGWGSNLAGAEAEARRIMERAGGYDAILARTSGRANQSMQSSLDEVG